MAENTVKMLQILRDNPRDMQHVQTEPNLDSSEKSRYKYFAKKWRGKTYPQKCIDLHSTHWLKHGQYNCKKGWGNKT